MANLVATTSIDMTNPFRVSFMIAAPVVGPDSSTVFAVQDANTRWTFNGVGFAGHDDGVPTSGTLNELVMTGGPVSLTLSGLSLPIFDLLVLAVLGTPLQLNEFVFADADTITGANFGSNLYGYGGNDTITGGSQADWLYGGVGNDQLTGNGGVDTMEGEAGNDNISGGDGNDKLNGGDDNDTVDGGIGNDEVRGGGGTNTLLGGDGDDAIFSSGASDNVDGGAGSNTLTVDRSALSTAQTFTSSGSSFTTAGLTAINVIFQVVTGGSGDDTLEVTTPSNVTFNGGGGIDRIIADYSSYAGPILMLSNSIGGPPSISFTGVEAFTITAGTFADQMSGGSHDDVLSGGDGNDQLYGNDGADVLNGGAHNDTLRGGAGSNTLNGGDGDDALYWDGGIDVIDGGAGTDSFRYMRSDATTAISLSIAGAASALGVTLTDGTVVRNAEGFWVATGSGNDTLTISSVQTNNDSFTAGDGFDTLIADLSSVSVSVALNQSGPFLKVGEDSNGPNAFLSSVERFVVRGGSVSDSLTGLTADDELYGNGGNDALRGADGNDLLVGGALGDWIEGGNGSDTVDYSTSSGAVTVNLSLTFGAGSGGDAQGDTIFDVENVNGSAFNDTLTGNNNANVISGGAGADAMNGGGGLDTVAYDGSSGAVTVNLATQTGSGSDAQGDTLSNFENANGSAFNDTLTGDGAANALNGNGGADLLLGGGGADFVFGGTGDDVIVGEAGDDSLGGWDGFDWMEGGEGQDWLSGGLGDDRLEGGSEKDTLDGQAGIDTMIGGTGDDIYYIDDFYDDARENVGEGTDTAYASVNWGIRANVENLFLIGSANIDAFGDGANNTLVGNDANNLMGGYGGADWIEGRGGVDWLSGGDGDDRLEGGAGNDTLEGQAGWDTMIGGLGDDVYFVEHVADEVRENASEGNDIVFTSVSWTIAANVETVILTGTDAIAGYGSGGNDTVAGNDAANVITGIGGNDWIEGKGGADWLEGGLGADRIDGGAGADRVDGGGGADTLFGGTGTDTFVYNAASDSPTGAGNFDSIRDFEVGVDKINIAALHGVGATFSITVSSGSSYVQVDVNGDGTAETRIEVLGVANVSTGDIIW